MLLSLKLPWDGTNYTPINSNPAKNFPEGATDLATIINKFGEAALYIGGFLMFFWAVWGVFDYLLAEGNKEGLAKARKKIQWAIVGFIILLLAFFLSNTIKTILNPGEPAITRLELRK